MGLNGFDVLRNVGVFFFMMTRKCLDKIRPICSSKLKMLSAYNSVYGKLLSNAQDSLVRAC
jgi:hypothetical protein